MSATYANPPQGALHGKWLGGNLVIYPGDIAGNMYFVDSNNSSASNGGTGWDDALPTIDAAVNECTASNDDWIIVHPAHAENLAADSAIDIDVAGVTVYGIRHGRQMPTLNATATTGDCKLAAAGVTVQNLRFLGGIDATTGVVEVSAADCSIIDCEYRDVTGQATDIVMTTTAADRLEISGFTCFGAAADGGDTAICLVGCDDVHIHDCYIYGNFDLGAIQCRTTKCDRLRVHDCTIWTAGTEDLAIKDLITGSTGIIGPNLQIVLKDHAANITEAITGATFHQVDPIYVVNLAGEKAMLINTTASTDA